jgi:hypothetical protein
MPPPFIFTTFNPTQKWVKKKFYEPYKNGELKEPYFFLEALPDDNPFVTQDQWSAWKTLDPINYDRFIKGDWNAFTVKKKFAYAFDEQKHVKPCKYDDSDYVYLSFDFNIDPMTCVAAQYIDGQIRFIREFRISESNIYEMCEVILSAFDPAPTFIVTGDASGKNSSALVRGRLNYYKVIKAQLGLLDTQLKVPTFNPAISDSRIVTNSILANFDLIIDPSCETLIEDIKFVEVKESESGKGIEIDKTKDKHKGHIFDGFRYYLHRFHSHLIKIPSSESVEERTFEDVE